MTPTWRERVEEAAKEQLRMFLRQGKKQCLIPRPGVPMASWHKEEFCACEIKASFQNGAEFARQDEKARAEKLVEALKRIENECACDTPEVCYDVAVAALKEYEGER